MDRIFLARSGVVVVTIVAGGHALAMGAPPEKAPQESSGSKPMEKGLPTIGRVAQQKLFTPDERTKFCIETSFSPRSLSRPDLNYLGRPLTEELLKAFTLNGYPEGLPYGLPRLSRIFGSKAGCDPAHDIFFQLSVMADDESSAFKVTLEVMQAGQKWTRTTPINGDPSRLETFYPAIASLAAEVVNSVNWGADSKETAA